MSTSVLLSIKPKYADAILDGTKTFELRRAVFRNPDVRRAVIYASSPISRVIGEFSIADVLELEPEKLWRATAKGSGVDREFFDDYFRGRKTGYALQVQKPKRYAKPLHLTDHFGFSRPPQSFCYLF